MNTARELKRTRLGYIPHDWEIKKLDEIALVTMGQSPKSENYNENKEGLPLIQGNADCEKRYTNPRLWTTQITKTCNVGDIILTVRAPVGYVSKSLHYACIGRGVCSIRSKENQDYLYYYLINYENKWKRISQGSTFESINSDDIKKIDILLPPLKEQNKIASILSTWDKAIELKEKLIEQKKELKKGLMQKLLTGEVRLPGFEGEWIEYQVGEICTLTRGRVISKKEMEENIGIYPVYSSQTSNEGKIGSIDTYDFDGEYVTWTTDGANAGTVFYRNGKFNCTNVCGVLKLKREDIDARYLAYVLASNTGRYVVRHGNPKLMNNIMEIIPVKIFNNFEFQKYICDFFDIVDKEINLIEKETNELKQQKKGLMQLLLTGKVRVKV